MLRDSKNVDNVLHLCEAILIISKIALLLLFFEKIKKYKIKMRLLFKFRMFAAKNNKIKDNLWNKTFAIKHVSIITIMTICEQTSYQCRSN